TNRAGRGPGVCCGESGLGECIMAVTEASGRALRPGGVDWAARWQDLVEQREALQNAARGGAAGSNRWDARAGHFARLTEELDAGADPLVSTLRVALRPEETLLDAGAGAGRYTVPLAAVARHVTAVEPSAGMRSSLAN